MSSSSKRQVLAIEGVGSDTSKSEGIGWLWGSRYTSSVGEQAHDYELVGGLGSSQGMVSPIETLTERIDPYSFELHGASLTASLVYDDTAALHLGYQPVTSDLYLSSDFDSGDATIDIAGIGSTGLASSVVWIDDEAILLGSHNGSGNYDVTTEGFFGTPDQSHAINTFVHTKNPYLINRFVRLILLDVDTGDMDVVWRGSIQEVVPSQNGTTIDLQCRQYLSLLKDATINRGAPDLTPVTQGSFRSREPDGEKKAVDILRTVIAHADDFPDFSPRVPKSEDQPSGAFLPRVAYQIDGGLFFGRLEEVGGSTSSDRRYQSVVDSQPARLRSLENVDLGDELGEDQRGVIHEIKGPVYEVLAIWRDIDEDDDGLNFAVDDLFSSSRDLVDFNSTSVPFHPAAIAMALQSSSTSKYRLSLFGKGSTEFDTFGWAWGASVPRIILDETEISTLITDTLYLKIDQMVLGWDGEEVNVWDLTRDMLAAFGMFWAHDSTGKITIKRFRIATVADFSNAQSITPLPRTLGWVSGLSSSVDILSGTIGELPYADGIPYVVTAVESTTGRPTDSMRSAFFAKRSTYKRDYPWLDDRRRLVAVLTNELIIRHVTLPILKIKVGSGTYELGDFAVVTQLKLADPWVIDKDGNRVDISTNTKTIRFCGMIIGRRHMLTNDTYELDLLLTNFQLEDVTRERAPSAEVASYSSTTITVTDRFTSEDATKFRDDAIIGVWKPDGTRRTSETKTVTSTTSTTIEVNSSFSTAPQAGDIVRLAELNPYPEAGIGTYTGFLAYTYLGDDDGTSTGRLGPSENDAHIYGNDQ